MGRGSELAGLREDEGAQCLKKGTKQRQRGPGAFGSDLTVIGWDCTSVVFEGSLLSRMTSPTRARRWW